jgi:hypothetical protein
LERYKDLGYIEGDLISDLEVVKIKILKSLDPYLRIQIQKRGITITQNIYTALDTEYETINHLKFVNKLISVQTAIQTRTIIKVPLNKRYNLAYAHPLTSEITEYYTPKIVN